MVARHRFPLPLLVVVALLLAAPRAFASPSAGSFRVSLRGALFTRSSGQREVVGMLSVAVPLDRFFAPRRSLVTPRGFQPSDALSEGPGNDGPEQADTAADDGGEVKTALRPSLARAAVHAALRAHGFVRSRRRLSSMSSRARASATLPEVRLRAARSNDESLRLSPTSSDPYRYTQAGGTTLWFEARLTWKLDRLVFADEELAVERLRQKRDKARIELVGRVLAALFAWQRALVKSADASLPPTDRTLARLDALEAETTLDVLTGGWFSRRRRAKR